MKYIQKYKSIIAGGVLAIILAVGSFAFPLQATVLPIAGNTYNLYGAGISNSATSINLQSFTIRQTGQKIQDSDMSDTFYVTLDPGNTSRQEIASCTTVTQNVNNTATLSGCVRGLSPITPHTASSTLRFPHSGAAQVVFSDAPQLFNQYAAKENNETISGTWTFSTFPITPSNGTSSETVAGVVELATGPEAAASTLTGATTARLALSTAISTSTYNSSTAANRVVVTGSGGLIDNNFIASSTLGVPPPGALMAYASTTAPTGWLLADGTSYLRATYPNLYGILGCSYVCADGTHFNVPDLRGRGILMASTTANVGQTGGESNHTQTLNELAPHTHDVTTTSTGGGGANTVQRAPLNSSATVGAAALSAGGGAPMNVLDPYMALPYIIKY
jgi:microcystin-dependent protein